MQTSPSSVGEDELTIAEGLSRARAVQV